MRNGCEFCRGCTNETICPPQLQPEVYDEHNTIRSIPDRFGEIEFQDAPINCRHLTCSMRGMLAAYKAWKTKNFSEFVVFNADGQAQHEQGVAFGTHDKPTHIDEIRIVTETGKIASSQDGKFYYTGDQLPLRGN